MEKKDHDFWLNKWSANNIPFHHPTVDPDLIVYLPRLHLSAGDRILVPLCGKTRDMPWLVDQGYSVIGVELSPIACQDFFTENKIDPPRITQEKTFTLFESENITLYCGDFFDLQIDQLPLVHAVYDHRALIALPADLRRPYVDHLISYVGTHIKILLITLETSDPPHLIQGPPFPVSQDEVQALYGQEFEIKLLERTVVQDIPDRFREKGYKNLVKAVYLID